MNPMFSIIIPTLQRESLIRCVDSVLLQSFTDWEMIIQVDAEHLNKEIISRIPVAHNIWIECCGERHGNFGNHCRHIAWERTTGTYCIFLDDDNFLASNQTLKLIAKALKNEPDFAIFPILRHGSHFFNDPPGLCMTDTLNVVVKRELGRWPDIE